MNLFTQLLQAIKQMQTPKKPVPQYNVSTNLYPNGKGYAVPGDNMPYQSKISYDLEQRNTPLWFDTWSPSSPKTARDLTAAAGVYQRYKQPLKVQTNNMDEAYNHTLKVPPMGMPAKGKRRTY